MKLDLEGDDIFFVNATVKEVRGDDEKSDLSERIDLELDNAQARVFGGEAKTAYVVIEIKA